MISTPTFSDLAVRKGAELNLGSSPMESASAESEPLISERLKLPSSTLRPSAAEAFSSMVGRNWLTGIKNGATRTSTINTPTTIRTIFNAFFMATSKPGGMHDSPNAERGEQPSDYIPEGGPSRLSTLGQGDGNGEAGARRPPV